LNRRKCGTKRLRKRRQGDGNGALIDADNRLADANALSKISRADRRETAISSGSVTNLLFSPISCAV